MGTSWTSSACRRAASHSLADNVPLDWDTVSDVLWYRHKDVLLLQGHRYRETQSPEQPTLLPFKPVCCITIIWVDLHSSSFEILGAQVVDVNYSNKGTRTGGIGSYSAMVVVGNFKACSALWTCLVSSVDRVG